MYNDTIDDLFYIGGNLTQVNGVYCRGMFTYSNTGVQVLDTLNNVSFPTLAITRYQNEIYVGGFVGVFRYRNNAWDSVIVDQNSVFTSFYNIEDTLLIGGGIDNLYGFSNRGVVKYSNGSFSAFKGLKSQLSLTPSIDVIVPYKDQLVLGGNIDTTITKEILSWNGQSWNKFNGGIPGSGSEWVNDMVVFQGDLYVGGAFTKAGGAKADHIMRWDGQDWHQLGNGINGLSVDDMIIYDGKLWVSGIIFKAGSMDVNFICAWDGEKWCKPQGDFDCPIGSMGIYHDTLFVSGCFKDLNGDPTMDYIAKYNPSKSLTCDTVLGISNNDQEVQTLRLYPNPADELLIIESSMDLKSAEIKVFNTFGQEIVFKSVLIGDGLSIDISSLENGTYFVMVSKDETRTSSRFIKR